MAAVAIAAETAESHRRNDDATGLYYAYVCSLRRRKLYDQKDIVFGGWREGRGNEAIPARGSVSSAATPASHRLRL